MNKLIMLKSALVATALSASTMSFAQTDHAKLSKQLEIMSNILKTAFKQERGNVMRINSIDAGYLEGQGVVYTLRASSSSSWHFHFDNDFDFPAHFEIPEPVMAPDVKVIVENDFQSAQVVEVRREQIRDALDSAKDAMRSAQRSLRRLNDKDRHIDREIRDLEREKKDLEYQKSHSDADDKKELEQELKLVEKQVVAMKAEKKKLDSNLSKLKKEQLDRMKDALTKQKQYYTEFLRHYESVISETLCDYGASLRALPKGEKVSFILDDIRIPENRKEKDLVYVFTKANVIKCMTGDIDAKKLLGTAVSYQF